MNCPECRKGKSIAYAGRVLSRGSLTACLARDSVHPEFRRRSPFRSPGNRPGRGGPLRGSPRSSGSPRISKGWGGGVVRSATPESSIGCEVLLCAVSPPRARASSPVSWNSVEFFVNRVKDAVRLKEYGAFPNRQNGLTQECAESTGRSMNRPGSAVGGSGSAKGLPTLRKPTTGSAGQPGQPPVGGTREHRRKRPPRCEPGATCVPRTAGAPLPHTAPGTARTGPARVPVSPAGTPRSSAGTAPP